MLRQNTTQNLDQQIHTLFTGKEGTAADAIDETLAYIQIALLAKPTRPGTRSRVSARDLTRRLFARNWHLEQRVP